jgi:hypothetical protein
MIFLLEDIGDRFSELESAADKYASSKTIKFIPFAHTFDIALDKPYSEYFPMSSVNTMLLTKELGSKVFFTESNYDYVRFAQKYGDDFINHDLRVIKFKDILNLNGPHFIRDAYGDNLIKGKVKFNNDEFLTMYHSFYGRSLGNKKMDEDYSMIISTPKTIHSEYRFFVVRGKIITASLYNCYGEFIIHNIDDRSPSIKSSNDKLWRFAEKMIDTYSPDESFVIDVAMLDTGEMKVLECNCINCSGFYAVDIDTLIRSITEAHFIG